MNMNWYQKLLMKRLNNSYTEENNNAEKSLRELIFTPSLSKTIKVNNNRGDTQPVFINTMIDVIKYKYVLILFFLCLRLSIRTQINDKMPPEKSMK